MDMSNDQQTCKNNLDKAAWTGVSWVSRKFNIKDHGSYLRDTVQFFDPTEFITATSHAQDSNVGSTCVVPKSKTVRSNSGNINPDVAGSSSPGTSNSCNQSQVSNCDIEPSTSGSTDSTLHKLNPSQKHKGKKQHNQNCTIPIHSESPENVGGTDEDIINQLGLDQELDLGLGRGTCYGLSSLLGEDDCAFEMARKKKVNISVDFELEENYYTKLKKICLSLPEQSQMKTVQCRKQLYQTEGIKKLKNVRTKYKSSRSQIYASYNPKLTEDLVPGETVIVVVRVYWPYTRVIHKLGNHEVRFSQEIVMLASQTLDQLRDMIYCVTDTAVPGEFSGNPDKVPDHTAKEVYRSGFFFIENAFYNDFRDRKNVDYSRVIREWASVRGVGDLPTLPMESTRAEDLSVRLGYPYLYQHQGSCEHTFTVGDVRLLHPEEARRSATYPYVADQAVPRMQSCFMCGRLAARWLVDGCQRVPFTPCYFCDACFRSFNYVDGKKVGSFKAYYFKEPIVTP